MIGGEGRGQAFIIPSQTPKTRRPGKGSFHHPASGQEDKSAFGFMMFDHFQFNASLRGRRGRLLAGITLIHISQTDRLAGRRLHGLGQFSWSALVELIQQ